MPEKTFMNLPEAKQKTIFDAAIEEFSQYRFSNASINRIIKVAGIPRGSFYQYFRDKEDIYTYMYSEITRQLNEAGLNTLPSAQDASAFDFFIKRMEVTFRMNKEKPQYTKIALLLENDDSPFITKLKEASQDDVKRVQALFMNDIAKGLIKKETNIYLVIDMMYMLSTKEFFRAEGNEEQFSKRMKSIIEIIKNGVKEEK